MGGVWGRVRVTRSLGSVPPRHLGPLWGVGAGGGLGPGQADPDPRVSSPTIDPPAPLPTAMSIQKIVAREILDSRGNPTVEVDLHTAKGA